MTSSRPEPEEITLAFRLEDLIALCLYPNSSSMRAVQWLDLDPPQPPSVASKYTLVVQNLRLIKAPRKNVWGPSHKK